MIALALSWTAYTSKHMDPIYEAHAARLGRRPQMRVSHGGEFAKVSTTASDEEAVRAIISDLEKAVAK